MGQLKSEGIFKGTLVRLIKLYQFVLSPLIPPRCRYLPTCSEYSLTAIERFGVLKGTRLAAGRVCRCHPWGGSGIDEVPDLPDNR